MFIPYSKFNKVVISVLNYITDNNFNNTKVVTKKNLLDSKLVKTADEAKDIRMLLLNKKVNKILAAIKIVFCHYDYENTIWENNKGDRARLLEYRRKDRWKEFKQLFNI